MKIAALLALTLTAAPALAADSYTLDAEHTRVLFMAKHLGISEFWGLFKETAGSYTFDADTPSSSSLSVTIPVASLETHNTRRDDHLSGPDFFNAVQFPTITFVGHAFSHTGDQWSVTGDLTLHGVTRAITIPFHKVGEGDDPWGGHRTGYSASTTLNRSDYGMDFMIGGVSDEITLTLAVEGVRQQ